jgi:curli biogenesis system outer membrane secretion channel CsgG
MHNPLQGDGKLMKKLFVVTVALFTLLSLSAMAQEATGKKAGKSAKTAAAATKSLTGTIGADGKTFTNDADQSSWTISNPDKVKGHEGHKVTVHASVDDAGKAIEVKSLKMAGEKAEKKKAGKM